jgi:beta-RFAP synthase
LLTPTDAPDRDRPAGFARPAIREPAAGPGTVCVAAPGRLHLGFLDPSASLGRRFGSLGLVVDGLQTVVVLGFADTGGVTPGAKPEVTGTAAAGRPAAGERSGADILSASTDLPPKHASAELARAAAHLDAMRRALGKAPGRAALQRRLHLHLHDALPAHAGLGSGTQLGLAVGRAFCALHGLTVTTVDIARITGRGLRSGVGIAGFDQGGLLLDGGPPPAGPSDEPGMGGPAPLLSRIELPPAWRVLLVLDPSRRGLSGADEKAAITRLAPLPREAAAELCHEVLMRVLAGAASDDFAAFAAGLNRVQQLLGDHFAPAQGGSAYTSSAVARVLTWLHERGGCAVGQSSWGPTGFAIFPDTAEAEARWVAVQQAGLVDAGLQGLIVAARSRGAEITLRATEQAGQAAPQRQPATPAQSPIPSLAQPLPLDQPLPLGAPGSSAAPVARALDQAA